MIFLTLDCNLWATEQIFRTTEQVSDQVNACSLAAFPIPGSRRSSTFKDEVQKIHPLCW